MSNRTGATFREMTIVIVILAILILIIYPSIHRQQLNEYGIKPEVSDEFTIIQWRDHDIWVHDMYNQQWGIHSPECPKCYK